MIERHGLWSLLSAAVWWMAAQHALAQESADATPAIEPAGVYQDNIVIVLDASGSMTETMKQAPGTTRMDAAKQALQQVVQSVPDSTNVGLLVFSSRNLPDDWVYPISRVDRAALARAIQSPDPAGATPLGMYLKKGTDALLAQREKQRGYGTFRLLMVTDGEANDPQLVDAYLPDVLSRGITVDVIGVDMAGDHALATRVNSYRRADDPQALVKAVSDVFAEVGSGPQDAAVSEEQFEIIQGIPDQMASAMLAALTSTGNYPIGERPITVNADGTTTSGGGVAGDQPAPGGRSSRTWLIILLVVIFVARIIFRAKRQRGRRT